MNSGYDVFLVVVTVLPSKKEAEDGSAPKIVVPVTAVIARDREQAAMKANRLIPLDQLEGKEDRLDVRVLPFPRA